MTNEDKVKNMTKGFLKEGLIKKSRIQELLTKAMDWKDKQFAIEKQQWIGKALEWIKENIRPYYHEVRYKYDDFVNYMKGE